MSGGLANALSRLLAVANVVFRERLSPQELRIITSVFAQVLEGEDAGDVARAFIAHARVSKRFPRPADIVELLPQCRRKPSMGAAIAARPATITEGYGPLMGAKIVAKLRGRPEPEAAVDSPAAQVWRQWRDSLGGRGM